MSVSRIVIAVAPLAFSLALATTAHAQQVTANGDELVIQFDEVDGSPLDDFIKVARELTGQQFTYEAADTKDVRLRFIGEKHLDKDQFWQYFQAVLRSKDFVVVPYGNPDGVGRPASPKETGYFAIRRIAGGVGGGAKPGYIKSQAAVVSLEQLQGFRGDTGIVLTTAFSLRHVNVQEAVNMLSTYFTDPMLESVRAVNNSNSFVATGFAQTLAGIQQLIGLIDVPPAHAADDRRLVRLPLKHAVAQELQPQIERFLADNSNRPVTPAQNLPAALVAPPSVIESDARTNALLVLAAPATIERVQAFVSALDVPVGAPTTSKVIHLKHGVAADIANTMTSWAGRPARFVAHARINAIVVSAPTDMLSEAEAIIAELDVETSDG